VLAKKALLVNCLAQLKRNLKLSTVSLDRLPVLFILVLCNFFFWRNIN